MHDLKLLWAGSKPAAIARMTCCCLFSSPPGPDGHSTEPTFSWGCLDPLSHTCLQGFALPAVPRQFSTSISCHGRYINTSVSCHSCQPPYASWSLELGIPAHGFQCLANLSLHHIPSPFTSHFSAHTNGPEHFTCSSPNIPLLRCLLTWNHNLCGGFLRPNLRCLQKWWLTLSQLAWLSALFSVAVFLPTTAWQPGKIWSESACETYLLAG